MEKRGQVTLFVLIALIIAAGIAVFFIVRTSVQNKYPADINALQKHIQDCLDLTAKNTLLLAGLGGGYVLPPENTLFTEDIIAVYWYDEGVNKVPSKKEIQQEIDSDVLFNIENCFDFSQFTTLNITTNNIDVVSVIKDTNTEIRLNMPMIVAKEDLSYKLETPYRIKYPIRLGMMQNFSSGTVQQIMQDPEYRPISFLVSTFNVEGLNVTIVPYTTKIGNETIDADIYIIDELLSENFLNQNGYTFVFAAKFNISNASEEEFEIV